MGDEYAERSGEKDKPDVEAPPLDASDSLVRSELAEARQMTSTYQPDISLSEVTPVDVVVSGISVTVDEGSRSGGIILAFGSQKKVTDPESGNSTRTKHILSDVSARMPSGSLTAIIGGSGSGKTTLLNVLSRRIHGRKLKIAGNATFNGSTDLGAVRHAYVMQQDCLIPTLTVRETLSYSADLRLREAVSKEERHRIVEEVILELGLKECAATRIGNERTRGCSGGEKRRTSIGVQLLANPAVIFADEPTTGLDATSAHHVIETLKQLSRKGRTVIVTIHQPRSEIWDLFDRVVLLTQGHCAYSGPANDCVSYFASIGYQLPPFVNPADFVIDLAAVDKRSEELESASTERVEQIRRSWKDHAQKFEHGIVDQRFDTNAEAARTLIEHPKVSIWRQIRVLTARTSLVTLRDPMGVIGSFVEAVLMGITLGWIFYQLDGSLQGIRSRQSAIYVAAALQEYLILMYETYRLTMDIEIFDRERNEGVVGVTAFLISRRLAKVVEDVGVPLVFSIIFYFMIGFGVGGSQFMIFFSILLISQYISVAFATLCVANSRKFATASLLGNLLYTFQSYACGFFIQVHNLPVYLRWAKWGAFVFYAFGALCANEFADRLYDCPDAGGLSNPACIEYSGNFQLKGLGLPGNWIWRPILALFGFFLFFYIDAGVTLKVLRHDVKLGQARQNDTDKSAGKERLTGHSPGVFRAVTIDLVEYAVGIEKRTLLRGGSPVLEILKPISMSFQPGKLNIIMGPSGSGKTSLLSSLAHRLRSSFTTKYRRKGKVLYNGVEPATEVAQAIISFVTQDDDALLPSLTVRETLRFAAGLRLPPWMSKQDKRRRADEVLLKMGLKDCANNVIGSSFVKGISGGEKRRVTIAVQLLTDPRVLLLDEPTSGLDGFTAQSIMDLLRSLAEEEGRTVILTIHQSRSDLWPIFQNVLLLARGGHPVYAGPGKDMLQHFASLGFKCPETTNPADFALDIITVDLRNGAREAATRGKVQSLINAWAEIHQFRPVSSGTVLPAELGTLKKSTATFFTAYPILVKRSSINFWRERNAAIGRIMQVVGYGIVMALFFAPLRTDYYSIQTRLGFIQEVSPLYFVGVLQNVAVYPGERAVFYREHDDLAYSVEAFFFQYLSLELPFEILTSLVFGVLAAIAIGLPRTAEVFFVVAFNCFCIVSCGESLGIFFNTFFDHTGFAVNIMSVFLSLAQTMGGTMSINLPAFLNAMNYLSPAKYSIASLAFYAFRGIEFSCLEEQKLPDGSCPVRTGEDILKLYKLNKDPKRNLMALGITTIAYRIIAYLILKLKRERWISKLWMKTRG